MDPIEAAGKKVEFGAQIKRPAPKRVRTSYMQKEINLRDTPLLFFPPGKEMLFLGIYFVTLPYITGLLFIFFYVARGKAAMFGSLNLAFDSSFFLIWLVGYEILAVIIILWIIKNAIVYSIKASHEASTRHRRNGKRRARRY